MIVTPFKNIYKKLKIYKKKYLYNKYQNSYFN
jgi:hypothetical protein